MALPLSCPWVQSLVGQLNPESHKMYKGAKLEASLADAKLGDRFQFVRTGYFCLDSKHPGQFNRIENLKDSYGKNVKK